MFISPVSSLYKAMPRFSTTENLQEQLKTLQEQHKGKTYGVGTPGQNYQEIKFDDNGIQFNFRGGNQVNRVYNPETDQMVITERGNPYEIVDIKLMTQKKQGLLNLINEYAIPDNLKT